MRNDAFRYESNAANERLAGQASVMRADLVAAGMNLHGRSDAYVKGAWEELKRQGGSAGASYADSSDSEELDDLIDARFGAGRYDLARDPETLQATGETAT